MGIFKNKFFYIAVLILIILIGGFIFWYTSTQNFSKEILTLKISGPDTAKMGDEITYTVTYKNNGNFVLQKPKLMFQLPDNSLTEDDQMRLSQDLANLNPGDQGTVQFKARLLGKEGDVKVAQAGLSYIPKNLSARYESDALFTTTIDVVPINLDFDLPSTLSPGQPLTYTIHYLSNIDYPLENLSIKIDPMSDVAITSAVPVSLDNVEWKLPLLNKNDGGKITINGTVANTTDTSATFSAHLGIWKDGTFVVIKEIAQDVALSGSSSGNASLPPQPILPAPPIVIKKPSTHLTISQKGYFSGDQTFENSGPIPPKAGTVTTYTVTWQVSSDINNAGNVQVSAILPSNVTLSAISPDSQISQVSINPQTHTLTWILGNVSAGSAPTMVSFQFAVTPQTSQQGVAADIIGQATVSGQDQVTKDTVSGSVSAITTSLPDDQANSGGGIVQ